MLERRLSTSTPNANITGSRMWNRNFLTSAVLLRACVYRRPKSGRVAMKSARIGFEVMTPVRRAGERRRRIRRAVIDAF